VSSSARSSGSAISEISAGLYGAKKVVLGQNHLPDRGGAGVIEKRTLADAERRDWLRLFRSENVGPATFLTLIEHFDDAGRAIEAAPDLSRCGGRKRAIRIAPVIEIEEEITALCALGGRMVALCEPDYPEALAAIHDPPPILSVLGDTALLSRPSVAVVGAQNASAAGRPLAPEISAGTSRNGFTVISGLARGIDTAAHEGALGAQPSAATIAVIAGGADIVYPTENQAQYERIVEEGAVITEQGLGTQPTAPLPSAQPDGLRAFTGNIDS